MTITKEVYDALPETMKAAFTADPSDANKYSNGEEDASALKNALDAEKAAKVKAAQERDALKDTIESEKQQAAKEALKKAREDGDFAAIEKDYKQKLAVLEKEKADAKAQADAGLINAELKKHTDTLGKVFVTPEAMEPLIKSRLRVEVGEDGLPVTRVLDKDGKATAGTVEDLRKEFLDNKDYKKILVGSKGSGGGATQPKGGGGATSSHETTRFSDSSTEEMVARLKAKGVGSEED